MRSLLLLYILLGSQISQAQMNYPPTRKADVKDNYHGTTIADPYRWLEDDNSEETHKWVLAQNQVTNTYLSAIPFRNEVKERLAVLWNYPKIGSPRKEGEYYYFFKNDGLQNQSILYRQKGLTGAPEVFIDPNSFSADGTIALGGQSFSKKARYMVYMIARSGSDWQEAVIRDLSSDRNVDDTIKWIKFSGISWLGDEGFYYSRYPVPDASTKLSKQNQFHKVYFHRIGTSQAEDQLVYEDNAHPLRNVGGSVTDDGRFLIISQTEGTSGNSLWVKDLASTQSAFSSLIDGFSTDPDVIDNVGDRLLIKTNQDAPNFKIVLVDPKNPTKENWKTIIAEKNDVLQSVGTGGGYLFCSYLKDASTRVYQYTIEGKLVREIKLPGIGTASGFTGKKEDKTLFYTFTSYTYPFTIFTYNIETGKSELFRKTETAFQGEAYETQQVFFTSKDGTKVPMFITGKKSTASGTYGIDIRTNISTTNGNIVMDGNTNIYLGALISATGIISITGDVELYRTISLGSANLIINGITTGTPTYWYKTNGSGSVKRSIPNASSFTFPIGNSTYNPVTIKNNTGTADEFSVRVADEVYVNGVSGNISNQPRINRTWHIGKINSNSGAGVDFTFQWNAINEEIGTFTSSSRRLNHHNGSNWTFANGTSGSPGGTTSAKTMTHTGYTGSFSPFAIGDAATTLPVLARRG